jgi:hypothetical protein
LPKGPFKYIYIARDGKDVLQSYFKFHQTHLRFTGTFEDFFERFLKGRSDTAPGFSTSENGADGLIAAAAATSALSQVSAGNGQRHASWGFVTSCAEATALDSPSRKARNAVYDGNTSEGELSEQSKPHMFNYLPSHHNTHAIPAETATTVVIGTVMRGRSYLSNDKKKIYSEMRLKTDTVMFNRAGTNVVPGAVIDIQRAGGVVRLPSGTILIRGCEQQSLPGPGKQYVALLWYTPQTDVFTMMAGYEINGDQVYSLDSITRVSASGAAMQAHSQVAKAVAGNSPLSGGGAFALTRQESTNRVGQYGRKCGNDSG